MPRFATRCCQTCHNKHQKCLGEKPACSRCVKQGLECVYPDTCDNCAKSRRRCSGIKPSCGLCVNKGLKCVYSTVNEESQDTVLNKEGKLSEEQAADMNARQVGDEAEIEGPSNSKVSTPLSSPPSSPRTPLFEGLSQNRDTIHCTTLPPLVLDDQVPQPVLSQPSQSNNQIPHIDSPEQTLDKDGLFEDFLLTTPVTAEQPRYSEPQITFSQEVSHHPHLTSGIDPDQHPTSTSPLQHFKPYRLSDPTISVGLFPTTQESQTISTAEALNKDYPWPPASFLIPTTAPPASMAHAVPDTATINPALLSIHQPTPTTATATATNTAPNTTNLGMLYQNLCLRTHYIIRMNSTGVNADPYGHIRKDIYSLVLQIRDLQDSMGGEEEFVQKLGRLQEVLVLRYRLCEDFEACSEKVAGLEMEIDGMMG